MQPAAAKLHSVLATATLNSPGTPVFCNVNASPVSTLDEIRRTLEEQVTGSVRWTQTMERLVDEEHCDLFLELGPGGVLSGLLGRTRKGIPCMQVFDLATATAAAEALRA
jgi:[acyl-carrier-protein] S-malonyltransferase